jgi:protein phosphatase
MVYRQPGAVADPRVLVSLAARTHTASPSAVHQTFLVTDVATRARAGGPDPVRASWSSPFRVVAAAYSAAAPWEAGDGWHLGARLVADAVHALLCSDPPLKSPTAVGRRVAMAFDEAGRALHDEGQQDDGYTAAAVEAVAAAMVNGQLTVVHVGCMRAYLLRDGRLAQVTRDHTVAHALLDEGRIVPDDVRAQLGAFKNVRARMLGVRETVEPERSALDLRRDDRILLCDLGLSERAGREALRAALLRHADPEDACRAVIQAAERPDPGWTATAVVAAFEGDGLPPPGEGDLVEDRNALEAMP